MPNLRHLVDGEAERNRIGFGAVKENRVLRIKLSDPQPVTHQHLLSPRRKQPRHSVPREPNTLRIHTVRHQLECPERHKQAQSLQNIQRWQFTSIPAKPSRRDRGAHVRARPKRVRRRERHLARSPVVRRVRVGEPVQLRPVRLVRLNVQIRPRRARPKRPAPPSHKPQQQHMPATHHGAGIAE